MAFDREAAKSYGYLLNIDKGLYVFRIVPRSPAARADIRVGDVILKLANNDVNNIIELRSIIEAQGVGANVPVLINRNGQQISVTAQLSEVPVNDNN